MSHPGRPGQYIHNIKLKYYVPFYFCPFAIGVHVNSNFILHYFLKNVILYISVLQIIYLLTITLTAILITGTGSLALPPVSYIKSVDIWNITSLIFITSCLLEVTVVSVLETRNFNAMDAYNEEPMHETTHSVPEDSIQRVHSASNGSCIRRNVWIFHDQKNEHKDNDFTVKSPGESLADRLSDMASSKNSNLKQANSPLLYLMQCIGFIS